MQESEWAFAMKCSYDPFLHDACMFVTDSHGWYFDSGATNKHITSQCDMFTCLESAPVGNFVTYANNSKYPVRGVGKIVLRLLLMAALSHCLLMYYMCLRLERTY